MRREMSYIIRTNIVEVENVWIGLIAWPSTERQLGSLASCCWCCCYSGFAKKVNFSAWRGTIVQERRIINLLILSFFRTSEEIMFCTKAAIPAAWERMYLWTVLKLNLLINATNNLYWKWFKSMLILLYFFRILWLWNI